MTLKKTIAQMKTLMEEIIHDLPKSVSFVWVCHAFSPKTVYKQDERSLAWKPKPNKTFSNQMIGCLYEE